MTSEVQQESSKLEEREKLGKEGDYEMFGKQDSATDITTSLKVNNTRANSFVLVFFQSW